jgi:hypothetical protein
MSTLLTRRNAATTVTAALALLLVLLVSQAFAYNGPFCYGVYLGVDKGCGSPKESNIRRAIGHGKDWTEVTIRGDGRLSTAYCTTDGCGADTGYLPSDVTGYGGILNYGDPCTCGGGTYYGWLYP